MRYLKQNTDSYVSIGMVLDKTAGFGNEDVLTVTSFSGVLVKETQSGACTHTAFTPSATATDDWGMVAIGHGGLYQLKIPDSEINFVGSCMLAVWYDAEALPVWHEFMVIPANVWDSLMGTDKLDVAVVEQANIDFGALQKTSLNAATPASIQSFGTLIADIVTAVWGAAARTLTAISDSSGITTLLSRITGAVALAATALSNAIWTNTKAGYIDAAISEIEGSAPSVIEIRQEMDANSTKLAAILTGLGGVGTGPTPKPYILTVAGLPCADALVIMSTDDLGANPIHAGRTNALGQIIFYPNLPAGVTVYLWRYKTGVTFVNPDVEQI